MNYIEKINKDLISNIKNLKNLTLFGQNINSGVFVWFLTKIQFKER